MLFVWDWQGRRFQKFSQWTTRLNWTLKNRPDFAMLEMGVREGNILVSWVLWEQGICFRNQTLYKHKRKSHEAVHLMHWQGRTSQSLRENARHRSSQPPKWNSKEGTYGQDQRKLLSFKELTSLCIHSQESESELGVITGQQGSNWEDELDTEWRTSRTHKALPLTMTC